MREGPVEQKRLWRHENQMQRAELVWILSQTKQPSKYFLWDNQGKWNTGYLKILRNYSWYFGSVVMYFQREKFLSFRDNIEIFREEIIWCLRLPQNHLVRELVVTRMVGLGVGWGWKNKVSHEWEMYLSCLDERFMMFDFSIFKNFGLTPWHVGPYFLTRDWICALCFGRQS